MRTELRASASSRDREIKSNSIVRVSRDVRQSGWDYNGEHTDNMITPGAWDDTRETFLSFYLKAVIDK